MKKIPIDECPAGPALDAAVAKIKGHKIAFDKNGLAYHEHLVFSGVIIGYVPQYSAYITEADKLWTELAENHYVVSVCYGPGRDGRLYASVQLQQDLFLAEDLAYRSPFDMDAKAETIPHAITRVYLKVHGIEFVEMPE